MASTPTKKDTVSSSTPSVNKTSSSWMRQDVCPKKDVIEAALESELRDVTSIGVPVDTFMHKYFPQWKYLKASGNSDMIVSWNEKDFARYIEKLFAPINDVPSSLRFISDGLTTPQRTEKEKERSKPDFFLYESDDSHMPDPALAKDVHWDQIRLIMEHTQSKAMLRKIGVGVGGKKLLQLARHGRTVFSHQHDLRLLHGVLFVNPNAYLCAFTRAGVEVTKPILATDDLLHNILSNYLYASRGDMGIDDHFKQQINKNGTKKIRVKIDHNQVAAQTTPRYFQLDELLCLRKSVAGRATRIWAAQEINESWSPSEDASGLIVKDYWRETDTRYGEFELFQQAKEMGVQGIPELICGGDIENDTVEINTVTLAENLDALQLTEDDKVGQFQRKEFLELAKFESGQQSHEMGNTPDRQPKAAFYHTEMPSINSTFLSRRTHCRYIFCGRGKSLEDAKLDYGPVQLCCIIRDAMLSHYELYKIAGILHSDVSIGNILASDDTTYLTGGLRKQDRKGFIIDLDNAKRATDSSGRRTRTGTLIFMAPDSMLGIGMASLKRDLISFLFVLLWAATITPGRQLDPKTKLPIELWNEGSFMTIAQRKAWDLQAGNFKKRIIQSLDPNFSKDLPFRKLLLCINRKLTTRSTAFSLHEELTLSEEEESAILQKAEDDQGEPYYKEVIGFFDDYLGEKGEGDYGVKELAKIDERAKG